MLEGRPLYDTDADRRYFVAPEEWDVLVRAIDRRNNVLLVAPRGWGKTTLLRQLQLTLRNDGRAVSFAEASSVNTGLELIGRARVALAGAASVPETLREQLRMVGKLAVGDSAPPPADASYALMSELRVLGELPESTVLVDASHSARAVHDIFGRLRDVVWQLPQRWVIVVDEADEATALAPPADAFYDVVLRPSRWRIDRLIMILEHRVTDEVVPAAWLSDVAAASDGSPRRAIRGINEALISGRPPLAALNARARLLERAASLGRPYGVVMSELLDLGQASPSDDALLDRVGLTRARVTAILRDLLEHELVQTSTVAGAQGRPRTVYSPALGAER